MKTYYMQKLPSFLHNSSFDLVPSLSRGVLPNAVVLTVDSDLSIVLHAELSLAVLGKQALAREEPLVGADSAVLRHIGRDSLVKKT